ncbi:putative reverse transcriptase domain-containing protein, partial [Tanacetum coccineum]
MQQAEMAELRETDRRRQAQMVETLRVMRDMRREMGDMQAELLALREQQRRARQPGPDVRVPDHQDASRDVDSHIYITLFTFVDSVRILFCSDWQALILSVIGLHMSAETRACYSMFRRRFRGEYVYPALIFYDVQRDDRFLQSEVEILCTLRSIYLTIETSGSVVCLRERFYVSLDGCGARCDDVMCTGEGQSNLSLTPSTILRSGVSECGVEPGSEMRCCGAEIWMVRSWMVLIMPPRRFEKKSVRKIVEKRVAKAIEKYQKTRADSNNTGGSGSTNIRGTVVPKMHGCSYKKFMNGKPHSFKGTEGVVGLKRWFEKVEQVFEICKCAEDDKVKFAMCTFEGRALTWWNKNVQTLGFANANQIPWSNVKAMMTTEYCPTTKIQRMEQELWTLTLKGDDIEAYSNRFHELVLMCPELVPTESKMIEKYIRGFPKRIKGNITSSKPTTLHEAINMARKLVEQSVQGRAARSGENNKRKWEDNQRNNNNNNHNYNNNHNNNNNRNRNNNH